MKKTQLLGFLFFAILTSFESCTSAEKMDLWINPIFSDHMVLQQKDEVPFWGRYAPHQKISVSSSWGEASSIVADTTGHWSLFLKTPEAGGPYEVLISTSDSTITLCDVLIGEVWLASGQSNMEMPLEGFLPNEPVENYEEEVANADYPQIRYFDVARTISPNPVDTVVGQWQITSPETAASFSAAGYFFARKLYKELGVPIGIITSTWGGTPVESWMSREKITALGEFEETLETIKIENSTNFSDWLSKFTKIAFPTSSEAWKSLDLQDTDFASVNYNDAQWNTTDLPVLVENLPTLDNDGAFWFRKVVALSDIDSDYTFSIPEGIDDMDELYINGREIGITLGWNAPRSYNIPKTSLAPGENTFAIRVIDTGGGGGFNGPIGLMNNATGKDIPITKHWRYRQIAGIASSHFVLYHKNPEAYDHPPEGIASYKLDAGTPTVLFNGMIHPLIPYRFKGAIWYQGESNVGREEQYLKLFPGLIADWRERWRNEFPFYFVQIAPFGYGNEKSPALREAQRRSLKTPRTGMAVTMDIGLPTSIHPGNKQDVGNRLARLALAYDYGKEVVASGPLFSGATISGHKIKVTFEHLGNGLMAKDDQLVGFEIAGADRHFIPAMAQIVNSAIEVQAPSIKDPKYVRYAWRDYIQGSLFNKEGLPASSFTTEF